MSIVSPILVSEKQSNDQVIFDNLLLQHHYSLEKQCLTLPLPTNYQTEEEDEEDEEDDDDSCDQQVVVGRIRPSISSTRLDITPRANTRIVKNTTFSPAEIVVQPPTIQTYLPQLNLSLYSPSIHSSTLSKATAPSPSPSPLASITMDIRSPPQPTQSTSRFRSAFQRLRGSSLSKSSSVVPIELPPIKPTPSKSGSLAEKIKNKFHHHQQEKKKKRESKKSMEKAMPRSSSLSSITSWSRLSNNNSSKKNNNKNTTTTTTTTGMVHSTSMISGISSSSSNSSLQQQQQQYQPSQPKYKEDPRLRQPLRAVNAPFLFNETESKPKGNVRFAKLVSVRDTYSKEEYDRCSDPDAICNRLTADIAQQIKEKLNEFKLHEMPVHEYSRGNTHFFI